MPPRTPFPCPSCRSTEAFVYRGHAYVELPVELFERKRGGPSVRPGTVPTEIDWDDPVVECLGCGAPIDDRGQIMEPIDDEAERWRYDD